MQGENSWLSFLARSLDLLHLKSAFYASVAVCFVNGWIWLTAVGLPVCSKGIGRAQLLER